MEPKMEVIPRKTVDTVWIRAGQNTVNDLIIRKENFQKNQPLLYQFLVKFTDHIHSEAIDLTFYYTGIIWEIFQTAYKKILPKVTKDSLYLYIDEREEWLEKINDFNYQQLDQLINNDNTIIQTNILSYALDVIFEEGEDNLELNNEDQAYLFWLLIIVVDALNKITS